MNPRVCRCPRNHNPLVRGSSPWLATKIRKPAPTPRAFSFSPVPGDRCINSQAGLGFASRPQKASPHCPLDTSSDPVTVTRVRFPALDGYALGGFLHAGTNPTPRHAVVFATGGGIRAEVYRHFLSYLASHGMAVLAFDYRGIGESRPARLRGFVAGFEDWAEYDAGGAIAWMAARYPTACLTGMGHSIGALLIGGAKDAAHFSQIVLIAPHTGYHGDYPLGLRLLVQLAWRVTGPLLRWLFGYFPARMLGLGENLPRRVALQWGTHTQPEMSLGIDNGNRAREQRLLDRIAALRSLALVISVEDDRWATESGVRRAIHAYRNLAIVRRAIKCGRSAQPPTGNWDSLAVGLRPHFGRLFDNLSSPKRGRRPPASSTSNTRRKIHEHDAAQTGSRPTCRYRLPTADT